MERWSFLVSSITSWVGETTSETTPLSLSRRLPPTPLPHCQVDLARPHTHVFTTCLFLIRKTMCSYHVICFLLCKFIQVIPSLTRFLYVRPGVKRLTKRRAEKEATQVAPNGLRDQWPQRIMQMTPCVEKVLLYRVPATRKFVFYFYLEPTWLEEELQRQEERHVHAYTRGCWYFFLLSRRRGI